MNRIIAILLMMLPFACIMAEPQKGDGSLSGKITDKRSGEALIGVTVYFPSLSTGAVTDDNGHYNITGLPLRKVNVQVSYIGHKTIVKDVDLTTASHLDFSLEESDAQINEVVRPTYRTLSRQRVSCSGGLRQCFHIALYGVHKYHRRPQSATRRLTDNHRWRNIEAGDTRPRLQPCRGRQ